MAQQQSSRLHRLLTLLDTGSTQATRFTAARQIGDIAKLHPQDLNSLLSKVSPYLHCKNWDTRVAAAHAIGAIAESVKHTSINDIRTCVEVKMAEAGISGGPVQDLVVGCPDFLPKTVSSTSFRSFDLNKVLDFGALLASGGQEYDIANDNSKNPKERLSRQKQNLRRRLGLDVCEQFMDMSDMIRDEDLMVQKHNSSTGNGISPSHPQFYTTSRPAGHNNVHQLVANMVPNFKSRRPSARELNLLKRKSKINSKDQTKGASSKDIEPDVSSDMAASPRGFCPDLSNSSNKLLTDAAVIDEGSFEDEGDEVWPFHNFVEQLILDMFDPAWEVRHGSVMALREILTHQGARAEVFMPNPQNPEPKDNHIKTALKREREIDLNIQEVLPEQDPEQILKKPKLEDSSAPPLLDLCKSETNSSIKLEDNKLNLCFETNDSMGVLCEDKLSTESLKNLPENSELMNFLKLARQSWLKNSEFLQDCATRFLCVLSLDRFGDYVSDQVVAPVRETCAQALGAVIKYMHPTLVHQTLNILLQMQCRPEWEIRHGSLLGIKYLVAVRQDMLDELLGCVIPACKAGLEDPDDDVRAVAADALIPTAGAIVSLKGQILHSIVMLLWDILLDLDDLSPSTSSVMNLLAEIYSQEQMIPKKASELNQGFDLNEEVLYDNLGEAFNTQETPYMLSTLAPRLWPFMRHSIVSVRHSAIRTLERLLDAGYKRNISESSSSSFWPSFILGDTLRIVFQNLLLESNEEILQCSERVWRLLLQCPVEDLEAAANSYISSWIELVTTPYGSTMDASKMFWPVAIPRKSHFKAAAKMRAAVKLENDHTSNSTIYLDFSAQSNNNIMQQETNGGDSSSSSSSAIHLPGKIVVGADLEMSVTHTRVVTATALGVFASKLNEGSVQCVVDPLMRALTSFSGVQRQVASMVLISWFKEITGELSLTKGGVIRVLSNIFKSLLLDLLACTDPAFPTKDSLLPYAELSRTYAKMRNEASQLFSGLESTGHFKDFLSSTKFHLESSTADDTMNFASKLQLVSNTNTAGEDSGVGRDPMDELQTLKQRVLTTSGYLKCVQGNLHVTVSALAAAAVVQMSELPAKLNPIILPLMASVKREQEEILQDKAADALAGLICHCISRKPSPNDKLIKNLCSLTCMDPRETPQASIMNSIEIIEDQDLLSSGTGKQQKSSKVQVLASGEDRSKVEGFISRRGSEHALKHLCKKLGASLFDKLPKLWDCLTEILKPTGTIDEESLDSFKDPQALINNIQVVRSISDLLDETLRPKLLTLLPGVFRCVRNLHVAVRLAASRCITSMAKSMKTYVMGAIIENVVPMLGDMACVSARQGAGMLVSLLVQKLGVDLVPYAPFLVVPLLRCMSDCDESVRQSVTRSFAAIVPLLPLARGLSPPDCLTETTLSRNKDDAKFLEQLVDNSHIDDYKLSIELKVTLRRYQQEGINWLAFLKRFNLHGVLCDDMGLGKTLQASSILASDIVEQRTVAGENNTNNNNKNNSPSLIICPSTLVGHWVYEIEKFIDASVLTTLQYIGSAQDRILLRSQFDKHDVIVTSYDVVRKDVDHLKTLFWNYCILDEGHIIKNAKSKITCAVKQLKAQHRLILSGTPIQNNVLDLWSLFDFLMPGFLGTERQFQALYGKPLVAARDSKCSPRDAEAGALAMEALHKQVMPFLLRRTKDEVLSDLPEKIIQDRYCDLSPVQLKLYEQFSGSHVKQEISTMVKTNETDSAGEQPVVTSSKASSHVFQALQFLLKLCSHPLLVVGDKNPNSLSSLSPDLFPPNSDVLSELHKLHHSPKLVALQEILEECGIGVDSSSSEASIGVGQHRVLIFAQHKAFLDVIERDLFHIHMKSVTYLRLDGSVEPEKRFDIVKAFNSDPTIDVLLLTTHVGGLGLNLTSADTLVFMEHDWNPMRDHQAMDRAHRLGQRKVVNVHRLIMRGTLEEKVMSLQKFKLSVANAVINSENASLKTMNTDQLLDLFTPADNKKGGTSAAKGGSMENYVGETKIPGTGKGLKAILGGLEELWDQSQYTEEYNLNQFLSKLNG